MSENDFDRGRIEGLKDAELLCLAFDAPEIAEKLKRVIEKLEAQAKKSAFTKHPKCPDTVGISGGNLCEQDGKCYGMCKGPVTAYACYEKENV